MLSKRVIRFGAGRSTKKNDIAFVEIVQECACYARLRHVLIVPTCVKYAEGFTATTVQMIQSKVCTYATTTGRRSLAVLNVMVLFEKKEESKCNSTLLLL